MIVVISGLIGVGKSCLCESLCNLFDAKGFYEPVGSNPYLELYYKYPAKYAFDMQINLMFERGASFEEAACRSRRGELCICDRSIYEDYAFADVQRKQGFMDELHFKTYNKWHTWFTAHIPFPELIIHLDASIDTSMRRICERSRTCECGIEREYMEALSDAYSNLIPRLARKCPVVRIDAEKSKGEVVTIAAECIRERQKEIDAFEPVYHGGF